MYKAITVKQRELVMKLLVQIHEFVVLKSDLDIEVKREVIGRLNIIFDIMERKEG